MQTLIFCAGAPHTDLSILQDIFPDLLIGVDGGAAYLVAHGYTPDWAIGDFDSAPPPVQCRQIVRLQPEKNDTDLEYALIHILQNYQPENIKQIIILGALGGGRLDHLLCNIWLAHQPRFAEWLDKIYLYERYNSVRFFRAGTYEIQPENNKKYLSFIGLTHIEQLSLQGVKYPLHQQNYAYPMALISNEFSGCCAQFSFTNGLICMIQSCDEYSRNSIQAA
ncbi:thiamine diphosphokinase [Wielerella bovis]|uniref:thiamine diphosphokinase n=1 Tax=Wielerella bovis TaxID=2917790 RepID=UPI0020195E89|nr:thiamine diphosphokinase [Wielerella bovis]MCG7657827.1 thiamine diphosphokinase [Wielerella bovis]MCG7660049.1 thiamine diphosphokinase [Wielerella bovis]